MVDFYNHAVLHAALRQKGSRPTSLFSSFGWHHRTGLLIEAKRLVEAQCEVEAQRKALGGAAMVDDGEATGGSARGDGDGKEIMFAGVRVQAWKWGLG